MKNFKQHLRQVLREQTGPNPDFNPNPNNCHWMENCSSTLPYHCDWYRWCLVNGEWVHDQSSPEKPKCCWGYFDACSCVKELPELPEIPPSDSTTTSRYNTNKSIRRMNEQFGVAMPCIPPIGGTPEQWEEFIECWILTQPEWMQDYLRNLLSTLLFFADPGEWIWRRLKKLIKWIEENVTASGDDIQAEITKLSTQSKPEEPLGDIWGDGGRMSSDPM